MDKLPESYLPTKEIDGYRTMIRYRRSLGEDMTALKNKVHALLAGYGIKIDAADIFGRKGIAQIRYSYGKLSNSR